MISIQRESWESYYSDPRLEALWAEYYAEMAPTHRNVFPLAPDVGTYSALDKLGKLIILTVRLDGELIGFCLVLVSRHNHFEGLCGFEDMFFLTASARKGLTGYRLIKEVRKHAVADGCLEVYWSSPDAQSVTGLFERAGMKKIYSVYADKL